MLIKQIIEFELRGPEPPSHTCTPITAYFYDKAKIFEESFQVDYYLLLNIAEGNVPFFLLLGPIHLQNLALKCKTVFGLKLQVKRRIKQFNFLIGF